MSSGIAVFTNPLLNNVYLDLVPLFDGILTFVCYLMPKILLLKDSSGTIAVGEKRVQTFPPGIISQVNTIARDLRSNPFTMML